MPDCVEANNHTIDASLLRRAIINWGQTNFRAFPWRLTTDPYSILIAEIMLHRTQATQVEPVYAAFLEQFPDLATLAKASKDELLQSMYSLGLRWRVELLYEMIMELNEEFDGTVPHDRGALLGLPGVSEYIASAVRCFAWNFPDPLIDTNTVRITGRLFGLEIKDSSRRNKQFKQLITALVDPDQPRAYNYALLDLAHLVCLKKRSPLCGECPIQKHCDLGTDILNR